MMNNINHRAIAETVSGYRIDLSAPKPDDINLLDIAWHLANINRYNGATIPSHGISVAAHSIVVSHYLLSKTKSKLIAIHGLLHDAHEAYMGDITRPVKLLPGIDVVLKKYSDPLQACILKSLGVPDIDDDAHAHIKFADNVSLAYEAQHFMHSKGDNWGLDIYADELKNMESGFSVFCECMYAQSTDAIISQFCDIYHWLKSGLTH